MKKLIIVGAGLLLLQLSACYKNDLETLSGNSTCITSNMSFVTNIQPIINTHCATTGCHNANATSTFTLVGYEDIKNIADDGRLLKSIRHEQGVSQMPKGSSKLSDCDINKIASWIADGALQN